MVIRRLTLRLALGLLLCITTAACGHALPDSQPRLSAGCGRPPPAAPPQTITVDGNLRPLIAVVPRDYRPKVPHRLVLAFHGRTNANDRVRRYYDLEPHARAGTIFLYPSGLPQGAGRSWWDPGDPGDALRDYALFDALLARFAALYCVDLDRVYVVGHSLGASFANSLACARGDRIRAAGTLGGGVNASRCRGRVAAVVLHNPNDRLVDFSHGLRVRDLFLTANDLDGESVAAEPRAFNCRRYGAPGERHPVLWCPHTHSYSSRGTYYPHTWPEGTGRLIMEFFDALP